MLSVSAPKPLFPVAGYPLIYHHVKALSEISQIQNIFLIGKYSASSFSFFIESLYDEFCFKNIQYITDGTPNNEAGVLFKHKATLMIEDPSYFLCLRYNICSSFPIQKIVAYHKEKEKIAQGQY